jgi:VWFA-related protein
MTIEASRGCEDQAQRLKVISRHPGARVVRTLLVCAAFSVQATPPPQQEPFRAAVTIVPVDVRAVDRNGRAVTDLTQADFSILEDGTSQEIAHFSTQAFTGGPRRAAGSTSAETMPAGTVRRPAIPVQTSRVFLIVLGRGRLQVPNEGVDGVLHLVRARLLPQDRAAVLAYNRATDFTTDHAALARVVERYKRSHESIEVQLAMHFSGLAGLYRRPGIPALIQPEIDAIFSGALSPNSPTVPHGAAPGDERSEDYRSRVARTLLGDPSANTFDIEEAVRVGMSFEEFVADSSREAFDIDNLSAGIEYLRRVEGEKHLFYVGYGGLKGSIASLDDLARAASHARVTLNVIHTGGLALRPASMSPRIGPRIGPDGSPFDAYLYGGTTIPSAQEARRLAEASGGIFNANRYRTVSDDVTAMDNLYRFQYTLGYYPSRSSTGGEYRNVEIRVNRPGVTLHYRRGYYARPPSPVAGRREMLSYTRIARAFEYAGPVTDIKMRGRAAIAEGSSGGRHLRVDVTIDAGRVAFEPVNGRHVGSLEVVVFTLDHRQRKVGDLWQRAELDLSGETYRRVLEGGFPYSATLPWSAPIRSVKVVVYDYRADLLGTLVLDIGRR